MQTTNTTLTDASRQALAIALDVLGSFDQNSAYTDYREDGGWTDGEYIAARDELIRLMDAAPVLPPLQATYTAFRAVCDAAGGAAARDLALVLGNDGTGGVFHLGLSRTATTDPLVEWANDAQAALEVCRLLNNIRTYGYRGGSDIHDPLIVPHEHEPAPLADTHPDAARVEALITKFRAWAATDQPSRREAILEIYGSGDVHLPAYSYCADPLIQALPYAERLFA
ncbi:MAG: hypothetical protein WCG26_14970 [Chloroflexales bacterium]